MSVDLSQFHQVFFEESFENLDVMETQLMALDPSSVDEETINSIFRAAHSIKGGSGTFGFVAVSEFTHLLETLLDEIRAGSRGIGQEEVDLFLQSVDCLRDMLQACQQGSDLDNERIAELSKQFKTLLAISKDAAPTEKGNGTGEFKASGDGHWVIVFKPHKSLLTTGNEPIRLFRVLAELGDLSVEVSAENVPDFESFDPESCYLHWQLKLKGKAERADIEEVFEWVLDEAEIDIQLQEGQLQPANGQTAEGQIWSIGFVPDKKILVSGNDPLRILRELDALGKTVLKINTDHLPEFSDYHPEECYLSWQIKLQSNCQRESIDKAFEWVKDESKLTIHAPEPVASQAAEQPKADVTPIDATPNKTAAPTAPAGQNKKAPAKMESSSIRVAIDKIDNLINMVGELVITQSMLGQIGGDFAIEKLPRLLEGLSQLEHNTRELQESVMRIRMLPISFAFSRFPRMVRDLSQRLNKKIELILRGEQTELDKTVMERIGDPLVHLVRNAIDHGIESPDDRTKKGKTAQGHITLNAYHQSGNVVIEIQDDGRGLDREKLIEKAKKQGLLSSSDSSSISDSQAFDLIFHPGLSTAAQVSDVSGRGVGMDVVKRNIQELNGTVDIKSQPNVGTTITVRLPLTLAILDGQLVRVGTNIYIFPLVSIVESMQVKKEQLNVVAGGCAVFQLRDEYIPVVRLYELFSVKPDSTNIEDSLLVVVEADGEKIGVVVDELSSQQQVVIKSLEQNYQRIEGVSGATILGDGTVSLILDIPGLVAIAGMQHLSVTNVIHKSQPARQALNVGM